MLKNPPVYSIFNILFNPSKFTRTRTEILLDATNIHGDVVRLPHPFVKLYVASHPDAIKYVLIDNHKNFRKSDEYSILEQWVGDGLITSQGPNWAKDRKVIRPAFTKKNLDKIFPSIEQAANSKISNWKEGDVNISEEMVAISLTVIGELLFGQNLSENSKEIGQIMDFCQEHITNRILTIDFANYFQTPKEKKFRKYLVRLREIILEYIPKSKEGSLVFRLLNHEDEDGRKMSDSQIMDHIMGFLVAGHETTAMAMTWILTMLAQNPSWQEKVRNDRGALVRVIKESMRIYPPIPCFGRQAIEEDSILGYRIPKGGKVIMAPHVTHLRADLWPMPFKFDPDRFLPEREHEIIPNSYFPFGMGPRYCIGEMLAMMECEIVIAKILEKFEILLPQRPMPRAIALVSLRPQFDLYLNLKSL